MPELHLAWRTHHGQGSRGDFVLEAGDEPGIRRFILFAGEGPDQAVRDDSEATLLIRLNEAELSLNYRALPGVLHYFRLADATLIPLPPEHAPTRHHLLDDKTPAGRLRFSAGDAYIALSPGATHGVDSPTVARFLHLRDYFNAEKLAEALLAHVVERAGPGGLPEDVTVMVVEAR